MFADTRSLFHIEEESLTVDTAKCEGKQFGGVDTSSGFGGRVFNTGLEKGPWGPESLNPGFDDADDALETGLQTRRRVNCGAWKRVIWSGGLVWSRRGRRVRV